MLVYQFSNAQGIKTSHLGRVVTPPPMTTTSIPATKIIVDASGVDQLASDAATLVVEDTPLSPIPAKRG